MRPVLRHIALESSVDIVRVVAGDASRVLIVSNILTWHQSLWTFNGLVLGAVLWRTVSAFLMVRVTAIHASNAIANRTPEKITAEVAVRRSCVRVLFKAMRMREAFLVASKLTASNNVHCGSKMR